MKWNNGVPDHNSSVLCWSVDEGFQIENWTESIAKEKIGYWTHLVDPLVCSTVKKLKIGFDIGGVLSKYPKIFQKLIRGMLGEHWVELFVISDIKPKEKAIALCHDNDFMIAEDHIYIADYETHQEECKAIIIKELELDIFIDDHMGYLVAGGCPVRLLVMPSPDLDYYDASWKTDGSEGNFGRRKKE